MTIIITTIAIICIQFFFFIQEGFREREEQRRKLHHDRLVADQQLEERRKTHLKERENAKQTLLDSIKRDTDRQKEMRIHIKKQNQQKYRASILP